MPTINSDKLPSFYNYPGWMTEQLRTLGSLTVDVIEQKDDYSVANDQAAALEVEQNALARLRRVYLIVGAVALIYAEVIIPQATMEAEPELKNLGTRPLGEFLKEKKAERGKLFFAYCEPGEALFESAASKLEEKPEKLLWRYSIFTFPEGKKLMVSEVFLPSISSFLKLKNFREK